MITSQWQWWVSCRWRCHPLSPLILWSLQWKWNFLKRTYCNFKFVRERKLMPWYWVQEGVAEGTCMKVWGYGMAPFGRGPPAWTNKGMNRAGRWYSHDTQWIFLGLHDWDLSVQSQHPGRESGLRRTGCMDPPGSLLPSHGQKAQMGSGAWVWGWLCWGRE